MIDFDYLRDEYVKCYTDKSRIYMIQHYLKTFDGTQGREVPFVLFPRQQVLCKALGNDDGHSVCTSKYRQAGITTTCGGFIACQCCLAESDSPITALIIGNTLDLAQQMLEKVKTFLLQLPLWMWGEDYYDATDPNIDITKPPISTNVIFTKCNGKEILMKNGCKIFARSSGPNASRGISACHYLIFDECAFIENGQEVYTAALPTTSSVKGKTVFVSTPNGKDQLYYETCRRAKLKGTKDWNNFEMVEMFWYQDPRYNRFLEWTRKDAETGEVKIEKDEYLDNEGKVKYNEEHWEQMIKDGWQPRSPWYVRMCQQFNNDSMKIAQELDVSFLGSAANVVEPEFIEMQQNLNVREPILIDNMIEDTWIWKEPIEGHRYLCSCDPSRGDAADRTAIEILDMDGIDDDGTPCLEQVLEYHGKKTGDVTGEMIYQYASTYNNAFVVVDCCGGVGDPAVLMLLRLGYKNLYYDDPYLKSYTMQREASSLKVNEDGKLPGFHTNAVRDQMLISLANMIKQNQIKIRSKRVIAELDTWIYKGPTARIDHQDGCHDDTLTCLAMGCFVMRHSMDRMVAQKSKDIAILKGWMAGTNNVQETVNPRPMNVSISAAPKRPMPFYSSNNIKGNNNNYDAYRWLLR